MLFYATQKFVKLALSGLLQL